MSLAPGTRLGSYEIVALIGAGGMGEVYRARDGALTREVALKILPEHLASDPERRARFTREANVLATLNHPNIAAIYGVELSDHLPALVLEMVEGPTLADRLEHGPLQLEDALPIAAQIAQALEAAHGRGIIHRDLKPANIKVRDDGTVKVLDFGLAKAVTVDSSPAIVSAAPTITTPAATAMGTIMGTAAYMSPEQARGRVLDKRSDVWSFGAVLFEMLTGRRAFDGEDVSDTLANILKGEPDWSALPQSTPPSVIRALRRCLVKDPRARTHDIADVRIELDDRTVATVQSGPAYVASGRSGGLGAYERLGWIGVVLGLGAIAALAFFRAAPAPVTQPMLRFQIPAPDKHSFAALGMPGGMFPIPALSPDGTRLVFHAADASGNGALWIRALDSLEARKLPNTEGGGHPFWSPDNRSIGFFAGGKVYRMDAAGGDRREIGAFTGLPRGATWSTSGAIVFATSNPPRVTSVTADGGPASAVTLPAAQTHRGPVSWPSFLPDGRHLMYWVRTVDDMTGAVYVASLGPNATANKVVSSTTQAAFVAPGFLLFARDARLYGQRFDPRTHDVAGEAVAIVDRIRIVSQLGLGEFAASVSGVLAYRHGDDASNQLTWVGRTGASIASVGPPGLYRTLAMSTDARRLVYTDLADNNLRVLDLQRNVTSLLTSDPGTETAPVWSPEGLVYYRSERGGVFVKDANTTSAPRKIFDGVIAGPSQYFNHPSLGPLLLYFATVSQQPSLDLYMLRLTDAPSPEVLLATPATEVEPQLSPDGKWLAYASNETGTNEVYVTAFPPNGRKGERISRAGGRQPLWRADGRELFFVSDDRRFFAVSIPPDGPSPDIAPEFLFEMRANVTATRNAYVPSADGQRFLINLVLETEDEPITVISNWTAAVR